MGLWVPLLIAPEMCTVLGWAQAQELDISRVSVVFIRVKSLIIFLGDFARKQTPPKVCKGVLLILNCF
jgi:hypothetical protein